MTADSLFHKAEGFKNQARYKDALLLFKRAKRAYEKDNITEGRLRCFMSIGDVYRMTGKFELAGKNYSEAIKISGKLKDRTAAADAAVGLGLSVRGLGRWKEAFKMLSGAEKFYRERKDVEGIAFVLWAKGGAFRIKGDAADSLKSFKESLRLFRTLG